MLCIGSVSPEAFIDDMERVVVVITAIGGGGGERGGERGGKRAEMVAIFITVIT